ncbi:hypothetical protein BGW38_002470 [Lunasporangiospora selenospora]|uniref:Uncharacterized protein n=1 Tax=Lunasporangiospora selenospora TaxID=979761 RepID=A0A9P6G248_9FUNG|nr:hypothetical protein BGW38_002470 [Lunasporangiospora selenospora]
MIIIQRALEILNIMLGIRDGDLSTDNSPEGKRKKRKIDAESLLSNSKKIRRYSSQDPNGIIPVGHQVRYLQYLFYMYPLLSPKLYCVLISLTMSAFSLYVVEDDEADESGKKMTYTLSARGVIMIADEQDSNKDSVAPTYRIKFDDDGGNERTAPPRMVLDMPKLK